MKLLFVFILFTSLSCVAQEFNCYDWAETREGGCIGLLHHMVYDEKGNRTNFLKREDELKFLDYCEKEEKSLFNACKEDEKRKKEK